MMLLAGSAAAATGVDAAYPGVSCNIGAECTRAGRQRSGAFGSHCILPAFCRLGADEARQSASALRRVTCASVSYRAFTRADSLHNKTRFEVEAAFICCGTRIDLT
jgi:hypothetical protein